MTMRRKIFETGLSVETISLYLLCLGFHDQGERVSRKNLLRVWNGSGNEFAKSLDALFNKNILREILSDIEDEDSAVYALNDADQWIA
ncbi:conserved hypothetical protein [Candidatus Desulfarcum epimagneticum]|uniref:Uncharacterized protein n=1 Tax=uncultured Desulfobacteraceae bacterium TaxID=218296 RepID=A0A484HFZ4_9BACT|nr:conserved hypothetical protein [uncultured Desulfobacteraceae bacterium]